MNNKQKQKLENRLQVISNILDNKVDLQLVIEMQEIQFKLNKQNINFRLTGDNKYYYADQCKEFENNLKKFGYGHIKKEDILKDGVCFNNYSINNGYNQYCRDIKRFNNKEELLGFVVGYNQSIINNNN
jgi:hypothetical protein